MTILSALFLLFQLGVRNDVVELRQYLGKTYSSVVQALNEKNDILLRNTQRLAPAQAARILQQMQMPDTLPADHPVVSARIDNVGQGLLSFLFEGDFLTEQVNFIFCPAVVGNPAMPERVMTIQVLFDDRRAVAPTIALLQKIYQMPAPLAPGSDYQPVLMYPVPANVPTTIWSVGNLEELYQPVVGNRLISAQLWLTDKAVVMNCMNLPKL
jgi:hypothetical protein